MNWLQSITDRLVLRPSRGKIETDYLSRTTVSTRFGTVESWVCDTSNESSATKMTPYEVMAFKFPGAAGRAERSSPHPLQFWENVSSQVFTLNHHGYGSSTGNASLQFFAGTCDDVWDALWNHDRFKKTIVLGNSLGCISALYLAARYPVDGVYLKNPPPIAQLIAMRPKYNWWNFGSARLIADRVPDELDAVANASETTCPALFVSSENDRVVPRRFQEMVIDAYGGKKRVFTIEQARHHDRVSEDQQAEFRAAIDWLKQEVFREHLG